MNRNREKKEVIRSMVEFERAYFPKAFKRRMAEKPTDARALGISLAKESLNKIRRELNRKTLPNSR